MKSAQEIITDLDSWGSLVDNLHNKSTNGCSWQMVIQKHRRQ